MIRWKDDERTLELSVRDLVERSAPSGDLQLSVVQSLAARAAAGRRVHLEYQAERADEDQDFQAEARVKVQLTVDGPVGAWTVVLQGRVDGLTTQDGRAVVEEVKSTTLPAGRLYSTTAADFGSWTEQLEIYLWMLASEGHDRPAGRLVLVSLVDGSRHVMGVPLDADDVGERIRVRLLGLVRGRERRIAWMARRRDRAVPDPFESWRPGQREIVDCVAWGMEEGNRILIEAPTGLGKTAAVLTGALKFALQHGKQVFWATQRTTQQKVVADALARMAERGLPLRAVTLNAKEKVCLNDVVACRADACTYAEGYYDKLREHRQPDGLADAEVHVERDRLVDTARGCAACPFELGLDLTEQVDVVIGDVNYAFDPSVHIRRHFGDNAGDWVVVVDEVHQLVDRARGWGSPRVEAALAWKAVEVMTEDFELFEPYVELARQVAQAIEDWVADASDPWERRDEVRCPWPDALLAEQAATIDEIGLEYALRRAERPLPADRPDDPFQDLCRQVLRFRSVVEDAGEETVAIAMTRPGDEAIGLLCLDPSALLEPRIAKLGGFVGCSATISPPEFYRDLLGLPKDLDVLRVPSPFPKENRQILVAPRVSTLYRDRQAHAPRTAELLARCARAVDGNVAIYFPSFAMLEDIAGRWQIPDRELLMQRPGMDDAERSAWLERLAAEGRPVVLAAVLGGIFAEGIDLPPGALSAVFVAGPGLPPVGLERDLLREYYEQRYGQGFQYASLIPGLTRVVQAAGRLIRRSEDRGVIVLVGQRFRWRDVRALLPTDWEPETPADPVEALRAWATSLQTRG